MAGKQHALRTLALKLNVSGTIEVLDEQRLYKGSYGFIKLQIYAPETQSTGGPLCTVFCTTVNELGREVIHTRNYRLIYVGAKVIENQRYLLFETYLPKEFTETATQSDGLKITVNYCDSKVVTDDEGEIQYDDNGVPRRIATALLVSGQYVTTVFPGGWNDDSMELDISSAEAAQIAENTRAIEEILEYTGNLQGYIDDAAASAESAAKSAEEAAASAEEAKNAAEKAAESADSAAASADSATAAVADLEQRVTEIENGTTATTAANSLEDMTWAEISTISKAGKAPSIFHVGQEKKVSLSTGEEVTVVILGFNHDDLADGSGKAGITFGLKNALKTAYVLNSSNTNAGGWKASEMRARMSTFKEYLPSDLQSVLRTVNKKTGAGSSSSTIHTTEDELFLFSAVEVFGTYYGSSAYSTQTAYADEGYQYDYYKGKTWHSASQKYAITPFGVQRTFMANYYYQENGYKGLGDDATSEHQWWLRGPAYSSSTSWCCVWFLGPYFGSHYAYNGGGNTYGVVFGFCV